MFIKADEPLYKHTLYLIQKAWGIALNKRVFPGPQPVSIERRHFHILKKNDYVVCEKTDGVRHMLLVFVFEDRKVSILVNRALEMFELKLRFPKNAYNGTLLDGELYEDKFMVYDIVVGEGHNVMHKNFVDRLEIMEKIIKSTLTSKLDKIKLKLKTFHLLSDFETFMKDYLPTLDQKVDGLVFTPVNEPVRVGTHETLFKWKERDHNTIDFFVKREYGQWRLYVQEKGELIFETITKEIPWLREGMIVECQYMVDEVPMWWKPIKERTDKKHPNNRRTFYRTLINIKEDIKIEEFLDCM